MKKTVLAFAISAMTLTAIANDKVTKVIIPYGPGGGVDIAFRVLQKYANSKNIILVPEYKPGAKGLIGLKHASGQEANGNTLLMTIISDLPFNNLQEHFSYISPIAAPPIMLLASKKSNIVEIDMVEKLEATNPGKLNWASSSIPMERAIASFAETHKLDFTKMTVVPYKGGGDMLLGLTTGVVDLGYLPANVAMPLVSENKITLVYTNTINLNNLKDGFGLFIPRTNNKNITDFWIKFAESFSKDQEVKKDLEKLYLTTMPTGPEVLSNMMTNWKNK